MAKIFVASKWDQETLLWREALYAGLRERGHTILDPFAEKAVAGETLRDLLGERIAEVDAFIVLLNEAAAQSSALTWELGFASAHAAETGTPLIIPVLLEDQAVRSLPPELTGLVWLRPMAPLDVVEHVDKAIARHQATQHAEREKRQEVRERVKRTSADYIQASLKELVGRETRYRRLSYAWYATGYCSLVIGLGVTLWRAAVFSSPEGDWASYVQFTTLVVVAIALVGALARYSFILGKSYAVEGLRNSDRVHAIRFGEFYLNAFGENAKWTEVKEAFQHWNIDPGSAFIDQRVADVDPELLRASVALLKVLKGER